MSTFVASFAGWEKRIPFEPNITSLCALNAEIARVFGLPLGEFQLTYRDVENDEIEIQDQLDFEYFVSLAKETQLHITVVSAHKPKRPTTIDLQEPKVLEAAKPSPNSTDPNGRQEPKESDPILPSKIHPRHDHPHLSEIDFLDEFNHDTDRQIADKNLKTLNECLSDAEVLSDLKQKVDSIRQLMEQSISEMKNELVRTKRKNSGIVSREIDSQYVHPKICCSNCGLTPINGKRYKCVVCKGFELCEVCEENNFHSQHPMIRLIESVKAPVYYEELAQLLKMSMGNLKTQDIFVKKRLVKMIFGEHVNNDTIDVILNARTKNTAEDILLEFHKLLV
jgi:hypothetical protein